MQKWKKLDENEKKRNQIIGIILFFQFCSNRYILQKNRRRWKGLEESKISRNDLKIRNKERENQRNLPKLSYKKGNRSHSNSVPLYVKLEKEFEEKFVLPEIEQKQKKLQDYKQSRIRHASLVELR